MNDDSESTVNRFTPRSFRDAVGHFATGVTIVTAPTEGDPIGITVNSFTSVSLDPPLVLFSAAQTALSLPALLQAPCYEISVLRHEQHDLSRRFAKAATSKWAGIPFDLGTDLKCPLLRDALARFECLPYATHDAGDHVLFIARVVRFEIATIGEPLIFFRGGYRLLGPTTPSTDPSAEEPAAESARRS